jgi:hypothetical protein
MSRRESTPSYTQRQREVIRRIRTLLAERAETQDNYETAYRQGIEEARNNCSRAMEDLQAWREHIVQTAAAEREQSVQALRPGFEQELAAARSAMDSELSAFNARSNSMLNVASEQFRESSWLAETLVESAESKARAQFEALFGAIQKQQTHLQTIRETAEQRLQQGRYRSLPAPKDESTDGPGKQSDSSDAPVKTLIEDLHTRVAQAEALLQRLERRISPPALSVPGIFGGALAAAGAAALVMIWQLAEPQAESVARIAGIVFVLAFVLLVILRLLLRRRVPHAASELSRRLADASRTAEQCMAAAKADRDGEMRRAHQRREQELGEAQEKMMAVRREVLRRREVDGPRLRDEHQQTIRAIQTRAEAALAEIERIHRQRVDEAAARYETSSRTSAGERDQQIQSLESRFVSAQHALEELWRSQMARIGAEITDLQERATSLWPDW